MHFQPCTFFPDDVFGATFGPTKFCIFWSQNSNWRAVSPAGQSFYAFKHDPKFRALHAILGPWNCLFRAQFFFVIFLPRQGSVFVCWLGCLLASYFALLPACWPAWLPACLKKSQFSRDGRDDKKKPRQPPKMKGENFSEFFSSRKTWFSKNKFSPLKIGGWLKNNTFKKRSLIKIKLLLLKTHFSANPQFSRGNLK